MRIGYLPLLIIISLFLSCSQDQVIVPAKQTDPLITMVNPFIGTGGHGHTYPGASHAFGMMQLSPDTRLDGWDGCSGYHYSDTYIYGFSHTHLSGTGVSDYGDILLMPSNTVIFNNGADGKPGYRAPFSHANETAEPGFYKVHLDSVDIDVALTVSKRSGMHKYVFNSTADPTKKGLPQYIILDLEHRDQVLKAKINKVSNTEISGYRHSNAWASDQRLYFYIKFSQAFSGDMGASEPLSFHKAAFQFDNPDNKPIYVSVGISAVDIEGAKQNLEAEIGTKSFEEIKAQTQANWEKQLQKIIVESDDLDDKINFYTSLYHSMLAPNLYQDVDGRYRGMDLDIHQTKEFEYYTVFSLWDTYRAAHPLYTIIEQERTNDFINTFIAKHQEGGILPIWDLAGNYTGCMIGYHSVPVIADAYLKGIRGYDAEKAFEAMIHAAQQDKLGLEAYKAYGFIPVEEESESVSKTLEYAFDDWSIAQMAKALDKPEAYTRFIQRAQSYKNVYDPNTGFMRGRMRNTWFAPFDPYEVNFNYTEANAWQYSFYVPQDISGMIKLMGGKKAVDQKLDALFTANHTTSGRDQADITGLIGQYAHGNEPSHHMAYLYNYVQKPWKTQKRVRQILDELYQNAPDGISGNEDCGQMSAWYVLSAMGFYAVTPASTRYAIGTPLFDKASIQLENGNVFTIKANGLSDTHFYIKEARLNGDNYPYSYLDHSTITQGGYLEFEMTDQPTRWGKHPAHSPATAITDELITPVPFIASGDIAFKNDTDVVLQSSDKLSAIYYALDDAPFDLYRDTLSISQPRQLRAYAERNGIKSATIETKFYKIDERRSIALEATYANAYTAGGNDALIDGIRGTPDFRTGTWQGYSDQDVVATVDLGVITNVEGIDVGFLQDQRSWIFYPTQVSIFTSSDGVSYTKVLDQQYDAGKKDDRIAVKNVNVALKDTSIRYIKLVAKTLGPVPEWHLGYPYDGKSWIFVDEIAINE